jgi:hypothetical protein
MWGGLARLFAPKPSGQEVPAPHNQKLRARLRVPFCTSAIQVKIYALAVAAIAFGASADFCD